MGAVATDLVPNQFPKVLKSYLPLKSLAAKLVGEFWGQTSEVET
jgi:hypothetical protein